MGVSNAEKVVILRENVRTVRGRRGGEFLEGRVKTDTERFLTLPILCCQGDREVVEGVPEDRTPMFLLLMLMILPPEGPLWNSVIFGPRAGNFTVPFVM